MGGRLAMEAVEVEGVYWVDRLVEAKMADMREALAGHWADARVVVTLVVGAKAVAHWVVLGAALSVVHSQRSRKNTHTRSTLSPRRHRRTPRRARKSRHPCRGKAASEAMRGDEGGREIAAAAAVASRAAAPSEAATAMVTVAAEVLRTHM